MSNLRKFADNYHWSGLKFPVSTKDISVFENKTNISVCMLAAEDRDIYIRRKSNYWRDREINLLLISEDNRQHYAVIKSLSRLLTSRNTKHKCKQHFCMNCVQGFKLESSSDEHYGYCIDNETVRVEMPKLGSVVEFYDGQNQFKVLFIMYEDFEAILEPIQGSSPNPSESYTSIFLLVGAFTASSLMEKLRIHWNSIEVRIVWRSFATTSKKKLRGCTTCFQRNPWIH